MVSFNNQSFTNRVYINSLAHNLVVVLVLLLVFVF
jgi:hypothetical protein